MLQDNSIVEEIIYGTFFTMNTYVIKVKQAINIGSGKLVSKKNKREKKEKRYGSASDYVSSFANELTEGFYVPTGDYIPTGGYMPTGDYEQYGLYVPTGDYIPTGGYVPTGDYELNSIYVPTGDYQMDSYVPSGDYMLYEGEESSDIPRRFTKEDLFEESHIKPVFLLKNNPNKLSLPKGYIIPPIILKNHSDKYTSH
ncbi:hypothetical protein [Fictibacillus sp. BK138]|uniref:hypothetical protein n=1 Tax=Fictibacillus sp. BK138 TaxID=2512121 RepID=UPI0010291D3A|nr:hypothetical protein [Fictibacillus sp. BK138]RZT22666.1 hypothetical protein EV282_1748 [Fictibacillus sp. BK138]